MLARILRHDIRNRVNVIDSYANYMAEHRDWEEPPEGLTEIREAANDLIALGRRTRIAEDIPVESAAQCAIDLVATVEAVVERVTATHEATVETSLPREAYVRGTDDLATGIIEVVENAIVHDDDPEPTVEISVEAVYDGEYYEVEVADDGPGIPPDQYEVVTGDRERSQVEHANGLGLWLAYWICRACGGELDFDVTDGGSAVMLRVPAADPGEVPASVVSEPHRDRRPGVH